ncbi:hypothetical protein EUTSA_v10024031mg [Eutrema salsugineum]|uniref:3'-5' exonuclease domain-containing protein n=1 Tax=Eutrema salsugineum TaxID=72664 RepID=V4KII3_EUTSA|nr:uncharacterized protein LOC18009893 [Eutrema salsugineum]ESQ29717.1 hypothetical protein EUTSA_v10024031mg [Eutrema salsugineum]
MSLTVELLSGWGSVETIIATKEEQVDEAIKALMSNSSNQESVIGLDMIPIRAAPGSSTSGKTSSAILQLCDTSNCLVVRLHSVNAVPESLYNFLILPNFTFAGFGIKDTKVRLEKDYGLVCKNVFEVGPAMWNPSCQPLRQPLRQTMKNMCMPPTSRISEPWGSNFELTEDEITVAVSNAFFAFCNAETMLHGWEF